MRYVLRPPTLKKWTLHDTTQVASFRVFRIERHMAKDGEGEVRGDFFTFACPDWCNVVAITPEGELVCIWQYRFGTDAMSLEIPGGIVDPGESPAQAAGRELCEETGFVAESMVPLVVVEPNPALQGNRCHSFLARGARAIGTRHFDEHEEIELVLIPLEAVSELLDQGHFTHALVRSALEVFLRREGEVSGTGGILSGTVASAGLVEGNKGR